MADYDGGRIFLQVVPSFRNVQRLVAAEARRWGAEAGRDFQQGFDREIGRSKATPGPGRADSAKQGSDAGGAFGDAFKRRVEAAMRSLPPVRVGPVETGTAEASIRDLRLQLERLSGQRIGIDIDAGTAMAELQRIDAELNQIGRNSADIQVRADTAAASAQLAAIHAQVNDLDGDDVNVRVRVDADGAFGTLNTFTGRLLLLGTAGAALAPAIVPAAAASGVALAGIGTGALAGLAGVGALAVGFQGVSDAVKALANVDANAADDAIRNADKRNSAAQSIASAQRQVENAERGLANTRANIADQAVNAAGRVADAQQAVAEAVEDANRQAALSARRVEDAQASLARVIRDVNERIEESTQRVADAQKALADAVRDANDRAADSAKRLDRAQRALADAVESSSRAVQAGARRIADAERGLADAQIRSASAQRDVTEARRDAQEALEDLELASRSAMLSEEAAVLALERAQIRLARLQADDTVLRLSEEQLERLRTVAQEVGPEAERARRLLEASQAQPFNPLDRKEADLAVRQAQLRLDEARERNQDVQQEASKAQKAGVDGAEAVLSAEQRLVRSRRDEADANQRLRDSETELARTRVDSARQVADAQERVTEATEAQVRQQEQSAERVEQATRRVAEAQRDLTRVQRDGGEQVEAAQRRVADAVEAQTLQQERSADRIADAQERVADAVRAQEQQQRQAAFALAGAIASVEGANAALAAALVDTGDIGTASMRKLRDAMNDLSPAGQQFARFLYGLQPLWEQMQAGVQGSLLPNIQRGIENLLPMFPRAIAFMSKMGHVAGRLFENFTQDLMGEEWQRFFEFLDDEAPGILADMGQAAIDFARGFANLFVAFGPLSVAFIDGFAGMASAFADWTSTLSESENFQVFLDYLRDSGPYILDFFDSLIDALVNVVRSMAPFGPVVLRILTGILDIIAALPPGVLSAIVLSFIGLVTVFNTLAPLVGIITAFFSAISGGATVAAAAMSVLGGPVTLVIGAFVLLSAALVALYYHSDTFRQFVDRVVRGAQRFGDIVSDAFDRVVRGAERFGEMWENFWERVKRGYDKVIEWFQNLADKLVGNSIIPDLINEIVAWFTGLPGKIVDALKAGLQALLDAGAWVVQKVWDAMKALWDGASGVAGWVKGLPGTVFDWIKTGLTKLKDAGEWVINRIWDGLKAIWEGAGFVAGWVRNFGTNVFDWIKTGLTALKDAGEWVIKRIWDGLKAIWDGARGVAGWFGSLAGTIVGWVKAGIEEYINLGKWLIGKIKDGIVAFVNNPAEGLRFFFLDLPAKLMAWVVEKAQNFFDIGAKIASTIKDGIMELAKFKLTDALPSWVPGVGDPSDGGGSGGGSFARSRGGGGGSSWGPISNAFSSMLEGREGMSGQGRPPRSTGPGFGPGYVEPMARGAVSKFGGRITSRYRDEEHNQRIGGAKNSRHLDWRNPAHDYVGPNMREAFEWLVGRFGHLMRGTIYGNTRVARGVRSRYRPNDHWDHIHIAHEGGPVSPLWSTIGGLKSDERPAILQVGEYVIPKNLAKMFLGTANRSGSPVHQLLDSGGRLPVGMSSVMNATGRPELVLNPAQEGALAAALRERHGGSYVVEADLNFDGRTVARVIAPAVMKEAGMDRMRQMGRVV